MRTLPSVSAFSLPQFKSGDGEEGLLMAALKEGRWEMGEGNWRWGVMWQKKVLYGTEEVKLKQKERYFYISSCDGDYRNSRCIRATKCQKIL